MQKEKHLGPKEVLTKELAAKIASRIIVRKGGLHLVGDNGGPLKVLARGDDGPEGKRGPKGCAGDTGPQGGRGIGGDVGPVGPVGPAGTKGSDGKAVRGERGEQGPAGLPPGELINVMNTINDLK
ncbi:hypothetical protein LCGC14_0761540, partial [marine sediment metagenome]